MEVHCRKKFKTKKPFKSITFIHTGKKSRKCNISIVFVNTAHICATFWRVWCKLCVAILFCPPAVDCFLCRVWPTGAVFRAVDCDNQRLCGHGLPHNRAWFRRHGRLRSVGFSRSLDCWGITWFTFNISISLTWRLFFHIRVRRKSLGKDEFLHHTWSTSLFQACELLQRMVWLLWFSDSTGWQLNHYDLSPRHASVLVGITSTVGNIAAIGAPIIAGILTENKVRRKQQLWKWEASQKES